MGAWPQSYIKWIFYGKNWFCWDVITLFSLVLWASNMPKMRWWRRIHLRVTCGHLRIFDNLSVNYIMLLYFTVVKIHY